MSNRLLPISALLVILCSSSCSHVEDLFRAGPRPFGGMERIKIRFQNINERKEAAGVTWYRSMPADRDIEGLVILMMIADMTASSVLDVLMLPAVWLYRKIFGEPETEDPNG